VAAAAPAAHTAQAPKRLASGALKQIIEAPRTTFSA
jgi:hypothetical protein